MFAVVWSRGGRVNGTHGREGVEKKQKRESKDRGGTDQKTGVGELACRKKVPSLHLLSAKS